MNPLAYRVAAVAALALAARNPTFLAPPRALQAPPPSAFEHYQPVGPKWTPPAAAAAPADRIMILRDPEIVGAAEALGTLIPGLLAGPRALQDVRTAWIQEDGFKFRIVYHESAGVTRGTARGFTVDEGDWTRFVPSKVPPSLRRDAPIYFHGELVRYTIELVSTGASFEKLSVLARQEELDGRVLTSAKVLGVVRLTAGGKARVEGRTQLLGGGEQVVNFERTHVLMTSGSTGSPADVVADEPSAGLIDPPRL